MVLVDEINRATPKTQSSLLEAMAEHQVTADGITRPLPDPFMLIATENPIEYEGTFPLPEAQLDRFFCARRRIRATREPRSSASSAAGIRSTALLPSSGSTAQGWPASEGLPGRLAQEWTSGLRSTRRARTDRGRLVLRGSPALARPHEPGASRAVTMFSRLTSSSSIQCSATGSSDRRSSPTRGVSYGDALLQQ